MARSVKVVISAEVGDLKAKLREGGASVRQFSGELDKAAKAGHLEKVTDQAALLGAGLVGAFGYAAKAAADFDKQMSAVAVGVQDSAGHMKELRAAALQAGKDTQYSATEAAKGVTELGKAGILAKDVLNGGLKGALDLAAAGQVSVAEAAETAASAMTQFKLSGDKVPHVADLLAAGAGKAQGSVHDMGEALSQGGLVAAQFKLSIEDTTGVLAEFASAGLLGSDAGTSLKTMLIAIANPSGVARKKMDELGISFYDAHGKFIGLSGVAQVLQTRLKNVSDATRQQALSQIFGNDAIRGASILYTDGAKGVDKWRTAVNANGYATESAAKLTDNLSGDVERLKGSLETLAIEGGSGANGGLRTLVKMIESMVDAFGRMPPVVTGTVTVLAGLAGGGLLLSAGLLKAKRTAAELKAEMIALGPAGAKAASGLSTVAGAAGKITAAFAALQVASEVVSHFQKDLNPQIQAMGVGLERYASSGKLAGEASRVLGDNLDDLKYGFAFLADGDNNRRQAVKNLQGGLESIIPGLAGTSTSLQKTQERITAMDAALAQLAQSGNAKQANEVFNKLASELAVGGVSMEEFRKQFPQYAAAIEVVGSASGAAAGKAGDLNSALKIGAGAQDKYATAASAAAGAARGERAALVALSSTMKSQTDPVFALLDAEQGLADAQKAAGKAVKEHGRNSLEAKEATRKLALAAIDLQAAAGGLGATFNGKMTPAMRETLHAAGLTDRQINDVAKQFRQAKSDADKYAGQYKAVVSAPGAKQSATQLASAWAQAKGFDGKYSAVVGIQGSPAVEKKLKDLLIAQQALKKGISVSAASSAFNKQEASSGLGGGSSNRRGGGGTFHAGGWTGPGSEFQPAGVVHADEQVIKKKSRRSLEAQRPGGLDYMNATGKWPGYAGGGVVNMPYPVNVSDTKIPTRAQALAAVGGVAGGSFGKWPSSPGAQRGDSGVWRKIVALVRASGIPFEFGNGYRPGDPLWHGSGRAVDFMGWNQNRLADFFMARKSSVLELIHRTKSGDYGLTRGHYNAMPHQWPLHKNHLHVAMKNGGVIGEHILGLGRSGRTYEFGEAGPERVTPLRGYAGGGLVNVAPSTSSVSAPVRGSKLDTALAMLSASDAVDQLTASLKENGRSWSTATAKGRENRSTLISGVRAAQDAARAKYAETGSIKAANKIYADYIKALDDSMKKMGVNAATRKALLKAYSEQPKYDIPEATPQAPSNSSKYVAMGQARIAASDQADQLAAAFAWTKPTFVTTTATGRAEFTQLFSFLSAAQSAAQTEYELSGSSKAAMKVYNDYIAQLRSVLSKSGMSSKDIDKLLQQYARITLTPNRWGGVYDHAANGVLTDAMTTSGGPTRYAWSEPSTGGELFAPKRGNLAKTRAEVGWAVSNWWGGRVDWKPGSSGGGASPSKITINAPIQIDLGGETITRVVRMEVDTAIGQVANATVYQTA